MANNSTVTLPARILADANVQKKAQRKFGGLCREMIAGGEDISAMKNITSEDFPRMSVRAPRGLDTTAATTSTPHNVTVSDKVYVIEGKKMYISDGRERTECCTLNTDGEKAIVHNGKNLIILPDHIHYNGVSKNSTYMRLDTGVFNGVINGDTMTATDINFQSLGFIAGDGIIVSVYPEGNTFRNSNFRIRLVLGDSIYIDGVFPKDGEFQMRVMKDMPFISHGVCTGERMYGINGRNVYISEEENIHNWKSTSGLESDPATLTSASVGDYTACTEWNGYILFFKEGSITKLLGRKTSDFILSETSAPGIPMGYAKTLVIIGGSLYYCGAQGVYKYDGSTPKRIDVGALPDKIVPVAAATDGQRYYIATENLVYVYDTVRGVWCVEDGELVSMYGRANEVYMLKSNGDLLVRGGNDFSSAESKIPSEITFGYDDGGSADKKSLISVSLTVFIESGATLEVEVELDESGERTVIGSRQGKGRWENLTYAVSPNVCDGFRIRLRSEGKFTLASLTRNYRVIC